MTDVRDCVYDFIKRIDELEDENEQLKKWCEEFNTLEVVKENEKLKELLQECRSNIDKQIVGTPTYQYWEGVFSGKLLDKIDEVLK